MNILSETSFEKRKKKTQEKHSQIYLDQN